MGAIKMVKVTTNFIIINILKFKILSKVTTIMANLVNMIVAKLVTFINNNQLTKLDPKIITIKFVIIIIIIIIVIIIIALA